MSKKTKSDLGRLLIKDRFSKSKPTRRSRDLSTLHSSEVQDGYEWSRLNLQSVTEQSSFQEFLSTAELAGTEFQAEKLNISVVNPSGGGLFTKQEKKKIDETREENKHILSIPRRPKWDKRMTPEQLTHAENEEFLEWRRRLAILQEEKNLILTPYEKNLQFWRQLWRVVERSDVVVQIVDARNPLLFRCEDLEKYVGEISNHKQNLILLNKADYLTDTQRQVWANYFDTLGVQVAFYSATKALEEDDEDKPKTETEDNSPLEDDEDKPKKETEDTSPLEDDEDKPKNQVENSPLEEAVIDLKLESSNKDGQCENKNKSEKNEENNALDQQENEVIRDSNSDCNKESLNADTALSYPLLLETSSVEKKSNKCVNNSHKLLKRSELISLFHTLHDGVKVTSGITTIGLVGYPNVGKSSTINSLLLEKKVSVSATPGKTKHFQTLFLDKDLLLCDCPGLVMPSFVYSKAEMIVNGILSIDQMRDHVSPVTLVASVIPRHILEDIYGIIIPPPREGEDPERPPTSEELLNVYGYSRGFMTSNGQPDNPRTSRLVLKDFVTGKLLYCWAPPDHSQENFHVFPERRKRLTQRKSAVTTSKNHTSSELDKVFFKDSPSTAHSKGYKGSAVGKAQTGSGHKPWKDHSAKRNKHEKLRRVYAHLDNV